MRDILREAKLIAAERRRERDGGMNKREKVLADALKEIRSRKTETGAA